MGKEHPILVGTGIKHPSASQIFIFLLPCLHSLLSSLLSAFVSYPQKWMFPLKSHWFGIRCQQCPEPDASGGGKPLPGPILVCNTAPGDAFFPLQSPNPRSPDCLSSKWIWPQPTLGVNQGKLSPPSPASHLSVQDTLTGLGRGWRYPGVKAHGESRTYQNTATHH